MDNLVGFITGKTLEPNLQHLKYDREMEPIATNKYAEIMSEMNVGYLLAQSTFTWLQVLMLLFLVNVVEKDFSRSNTH